MANHICWVFVLAVASGTTLVESLLRRSSRSGRTETCTTLNNQDSHFTVAVGIGTPRQALEIVADTGSSGVIVKSCDCPHVNSHDCFKGEGLSSTFKSPPGDWHKSLIHHHFGSGDLTTTPASDVFEVGHVSATMDSVLLMVEQELSIGGFEGILGLGLPAHDSKLTKGDNFLEKRQSFMEAAGVKFFSICFSGGGPGVLKFDPTPPPKMLKQMGLYHWGLAFEGFSVGSKDAPAAVCGKDSMKPGMQTACGAIPDSGSTDIMGPPTLIKKLFADVCHRWPRCVKEVNTGLSTRETDCKSIVADKPHISLEVCETRMEALYAASFESLVADCSSWLSAGVGLREVPSLFMHFVGKEKEQETVELTSWAYISRTTSWGEASCAPMFGSYNMDTQVNGPVWVIGTPLFHEYQVVFGMDPLSIGFDSKTCTSCNQDGGTMHSPLSMFAASASDQEQRRGRDVPRVMAKVPRKPSYDPSEPF